MSKIYTKTGDKGLTSLFNGVRVSKNDLRVNCYGTVDELNSVIGIAICYVPLGDFKNDLLNLSGELFRFGSDLASPYNPPPKFEINRINQCDIQLLENLIDKYTEEMPKLSAFILPGGSPASAFLHQARAISRRAERLIVELSTVEEIGEFVIQYINRISDYLFTAARYANFIQNIDDINVVFK